VSLSNDGLSIAIGAPGNDGTATTAGHVRVYDVGMSRLCCTCTSAHAIAIHSLHSHARLSIGVEVSIEQHSSQADPTTNSPIVFEVLFTEDVADFADDDVTVTSTSGEQLIGVVESVSGSLPDNAYTVTVDVTVSGIVTASIAAGVATTDAFGVPNLASTSVDNQVMYDKLGALVDDVAAIEAKLDDKTQCKLMVW
jgi:hypothetical protein